MKSAVYSFFLALLVVSLAATAEAAGGKKGKGNKYAGLNGNYSGTLTLDNELFCPEPSASELNIRHKVKVTKSGAVTITDKDETGATILTLGGFVDQDSTTSFSAISQEVADGCTYTTVVQYDVEKKNATVEVDQSVNCDSQEFICTRDYSGTLQKRASGGKKKKKKKNQK